MGIIRNPCLKCKLYKKTQYPFLWKKEPGWGDVGHFNRDLYRILVVGSGPPEGYDAFFSTASGEAVKTLGDMIEAGTVVYHEALSCPSSSPKPKHLKSCREATFEDVMALYRPKVVIAMGRNALYWVTGDPEKTINEYRHKYTNQDGYTLMALPHLSNDIRYCEPWQRLRAEDLALEYLHTFYMAEKICKYKGYDDAPHYWQIVTDKKEAIKIAKDCRFNELPCSVDVETGQSMHSILGKQHINYKRATMWHEDTEHVCTSWTFASERCPNRWKFGEYMYRSFVFFGEANCKEVHELMLNPWHDWPKKKGKKRRVVGHNLKFDANVFYKFLGLCPWELADCYDTFYHFSLIDQSKVHYGLKPLAKFYFGADDWDEALKTKLKEMFKELNEGREEDEKIYVDYSHLDPRELGLYNALDTYYTLRLYLEIANDDFYPQPEPLAVGVCLRQAKSLSRIERFGLPLDSLTFEESRERNYLEYVRARGDFLSLQPVRKALARGVEFGTAKKKFLAELVEITDVTVPLTPKSKEPSITVETLIAIGGVELDKHKELVPREEWDSKAQEVWWKFAYLRKLEHKNKNFFDSYGKFIINDFIRPDYAICKSEKNTFSAGDGGGTKTGRLSSRDPQGQNLGGSDIVRRNFRAPKIKKLPKGLQMFEKINYRRLLGHEWVMAEADYDRKELVFLAVASQCQPMLEIINSGRDMHAETARELFDIPPDEEVPKRKRDIAKNLNFGLVYGQGPRAFAEAAGIKVSEAIEFFNKFHKKFPEVSRFFRDNVNRMRKGETIYSMYGRARSYVLTGDKRYDQKQEREANNTLIQGPASDSTTEHLFYIFKKLDEKPHLHNYIIPINTVHDSIWFLFRKDVWRKCARWVKKHMESTKIFPFPFPAKLGVEIKVGPSLDKMKEVKLNAA